MKFKVDKERSNRAHKYNYGEIQITIRPLARLMKEGWEVEKNSMRSASESWIEVTLIYIYKDELIIYVRRDKRKGR